MASGDIRKVGILSPGDMGSATGRVLHQNGLQVFTCLAGRSDLTRARALEAGFQDAASLDALVREVDLLLSILVPSEAVATAQAVAAALKRTGATLVYADCNAIAPQTVEAIERDLRAAGAGFVDAGIIGGPPGPGVRSHFHCSGPDTSAFEALKQHGIDVRVVGPKIGQASGLKMVYAASTKGTTALWTELLTASRALGLEDALRAEWGDEHPVARSQLRGIPGMPRRARRWVGEMEEIAATFEGLGMTPRMFEGAADMYRFIGDTPLGDQTSRDPDPSLDEVLRTLAGRLGEE